jgi:glycosyltransferase involved in cell wall biosynthesis
MRRVLLISYTFPPVGGAGVQRSAKFTKYLPLHGWQVSVLTAANPSVPLYDESLCAGIPADTAIERTTTWEPSYALKTKITGSKRGQTVGGIATKLKSLVRNSATALLQPDPQILWGPGAIRGGTRLIEKTHHDAIIATGPPFSSFLTGSRLSRRFDLPLVLDYRDEWDISNAHWENRTTRGFLHRLQQRMQVRVLRQADAVLTTTEASAERIRSIVKRANSSAVVNCVYNGYDPDDFTGAPMPANRTKYRITYVGTLWNLTSIEPLVEGIRRLEKSDAQAAGCLEIVVAGRRTAEQEAILRRLESTACSLVRRDYVPHEDAIRLMYDSDRLCILLTDTPDAGRVVPAKVFEYIATGKPLLTIAPKGEVWSILENYHDAGLCVPHDVGSIATALGRMLQSNANEAAFSKCLRPERFSRVKQASQVADVLESVVNQSTRSRMV